MTLVGVPQTLTQCSTIPSGWWESCSSGTLEGQRLRLKDNMIQPSRICIPQGKAIKPLKVKNPLELTQWRKPSNINIFLDVYWPQGTKDRERPKRKTKEAYKMQLRELDYELHDLCPSHISHIWKRPDTSENTSRWCSGPTETADWWSAGVYNEEF